MLRNNFKFMLSSHVYTLLYCEHPGLCVCVRLFTMGLQTFRII